MKVSIIGAGHVGLVTGVCFAEKGHQVLCVDSDSEKIEMLKSGKMPIYEPGLEEMCNRHAADGKLKFSTSNKEAVEFGKVIFVCVGTPSDANGRADMTYIEQVTKEIAESMTEYRIIAEKSTVPVLTGERVKLTIERYRKSDVPFDVVSNPEFLREGSALEDTLRPDRVVMGVSSSRAEEIMRELYEDFGAPVLVTDIRSSELIKHASNAFLAMKISFANAMSRICELSGADVKEVMQGAGLDPRIGNTFLNAGVGYGGSCFPKDVDALVAISSSLGYDLSLIRAVQDINREQLDHFLAKIERELWVLKGKKIAMWGLSFKPHTDDTREAPAIKIARMLMERGAKVKAFDPVTMPKAKKLLPDIELAENALDACVDADCLLLMTEWQEFIDTDLEEVKSRLKVPMIFDGRNSLDREKAGELGFVYHGVGRKPVRPAAIAGSYS